MQYQHTRGCIFPIPIGYDTPSNYRKRYKKGEIKCKETIEKRGLTTEPKFAQRKRTTGLPNNELVNVLVF